MRRPIGSHYETDNRFDFIMRRCFTTLHTRDVDVTIHPVAQEVAYTARLDEDDTPLSFESSQAIRGLRLFQQAAHTQLRFSISSSLSESETGFVLGDV